MTSAPLPVRAVAAERGRFAVLADVMGILEGLYPEANAEEWDAVGLVTGSTRQPVRTILLAVDPVDEVLREAAELDADLVLVHHPLLLRGVHTVAESHPKGALIAGLIRDERALFTAHTNADIARFGVSEALAETLGLVDLVPLDPTEGSDGVGLGRIGRLAHPRSLRDFARTVVASVPETAAGLRVAGDADRMLTRVAVCGGAGDSLLGAASAAGVDCFVTADLRHHPASESTAHPESPALIDLSHFASEWPWLPVAARELERGLSALGLDVETHISTIVTDPWSFSIAPPRGALR